MSYTKIKDVKVQLYGKCDVHFTANEDVNVIVGVNGSGKTALLNEIFKQACKNLGLEEQNHIVYIPSIDNLITRDKRKSTNALLQELEYYIFDVKTGPSMMAYRMTMIDASVEKQVEMKARIDELCSIINKLFENTGKIIKIEGNKFCVISDELVLPIETLSSGEMLILLILLRVFLLDNRDTLVLLDEPENSLDISWQFELINILVKLNPNAQYFIATHSPSIFGDGWGDKIIYMEDVTTPTKKEYVRTESKNKIYHTINLNI